MQCQQFRSGERIVSVHVHRGPNGHYYSAMDDIKDRFPDATRFMVGEHEVVFLKDDNGERYVKLSLLFTRRTYCIQVVSNKQANKRT